MHRRASGRNHGRWVEDDGEIHYRVTFVDMTRINFMLQNRIRCWMYDPPISNRPLERKAVVNDCRNEGKFRGIFFFKENCNSIKMTFHTCFLYFFFAIYLHFVLKWCFFSFCKIVFSFSADFECPSFSSKLITLKRKRLRKLAFFFRILLIELHWLLF